MPSAAKRRKAAKKKKKGVEVDGGDSPVVNTSSNLHESDDLKSQDERDTDSGGAGSPTSQDEHYPFGQGIGEFEKRNSASAPFDSLDNSIEQADCVNSCDKLSSKAVKDSEDDGERRSTTAGDCRSPIGKDMKDFDKVELLAAPSDSQENPIEETNGDASYDALKFQDLNGCAEKVYPVAAESDCLSPFSEDNQVFDGRKFLSDRLESQDKTMEVANRCALDAQEIVLFPDTSVQIIGEVENEDDSKMNTSDNKWYNFTVESHNFVHESFSCSSSNDKSQVIEENLKEELKHLILGTSLPTGLAEPVNHLPKATFVEATPLNDGAPLLSLLDPVSSMKNNDFTGASPLNVAVDSESDQKEPEEIVLSTVYEVSGVSSTFSNSISDDAEDKVIPVHVDNTGITEDGLESFSEDNNREPMPSSGFLTAKIKNGPQMSDSTSANNNGGSVLKENGATKLENDPQKSNLAYDGGEAVLMENGYAERAQNGNGTEKHNHLEETHKYPEKQLELPMTPRVVQKTSWMGCCGLFDMITGSGRSSPY